MHRDRRWRDESSGRDIDDPLAPLDGGGGAELKEQVLDVAREGGRRQEDGETGIGSAAADLIEKVFSRRRSRFFGTLLSFQREHAEYHRAVPGHFLSCCFDLRSLKTLFFFALITLLLSYLMSQMRLVVHFRFRTPE